MLDLATGAIHEIGPGVDSAPWVDDETVLTINRTGTAQLGINVDTRATTVAPTFDPLGEPFTAKVRGDLKLLPITDRVSHHLRGTPTPYRQDALAVRGGGRGVCHGR